ncbi:hypothetical protein H5410_038599 [Solanum commersonii]|uniref:Uncharacterized protein n=1 Tax=Solanum commersonii TaxID=4109 RepID=A0A9J5YBU3_SOLCO|nr:hypothetical protein H5410_038599 [Solanum commersonii]
MPMDAMPLSKTPQKSPKQKFRHRLKISKKYKLNPYSFRNGKQSHYCSHTHISKPKATHTFMNYVNKSSNG